MKKISVIVPVYNVANYLDKCINSVLSQTYTNLEIILVDDGSTDNSGSICDDWNKRDNRVILIHKPNGGLSDARNVGLDIATGDYIGFVDSDDFIEPDMFELLVKNIEKYQADVSCCRYANVYEDGSRYAVGDDHNIKLLEGLDGLKEYLYGKTLDPFVCNKLYRTYTIRNTLDKTYYIHFVKGILGEDNPFNIEVFEHTKRVVIAGEAKYNYLQKRPGAITNSAVSQKKIDSVFWWDSVRQKCHERYPELEKYALRRQALFYIGLYNRTHNDTYYECVSTKVRNFIKEHLSEILCSDICEMQVKIAALFLAKCAVVYGILVCLYKKVFGEARL